MLELSKKLAKQAKQLETYDPFIQELAEEGSLDNEYLEMIAAIKNEIEMKDLPNHSERRKICGCRENVSIAEMGGGHRLILRDGEILIPKSLRKHMLQNLHITHCSDKLMLINAKRRIFWPDIKKDIRAFYESSLECL